MRSWRKSTSRPHRHSGKPSDASGRGSSISKGRGELLTSTKDIVGKQKKNFKELLNPTNTPSIKEAFNCVLSGILCEVISSVRTSGKGCTVPIQPE